MYENNMRTKPSATSMYKSCHVRKFLDLQYTVEVWWRTKDKNEGIIDYCVHLRPPTSHQARCTIMKKERRQKIQKKGEPTRRGKRGREKKDGDASPNGSCHKKE